MKNVIFWDVITCGSCVLQLLVTAKVSNLHILFTLMMEAIWSSEMSILARATWHKTPEYGILHSQCSENLKSYMALNPRRPQLKAQCLQSINLRYVQSCKVEVFIAVTM
jgi:hypothetical protein